MLSKTPVYLGNLPMVQQIYCGVPGPPCLSILLRSLTDKLYFLLSKVTLVRTVAGCFDGDPASLACDNICLLVANLHTSGLSSRSCLKEQGRYVGPLHVVVK